MTDEEWVVLEEVPGPFQADILSGLLEAQEIPTILLQEGVGRAVGFTVGPLGIVQILVPLSQLDRANGILDDYYAGRLAIQDAMDDQNDSDED